LDEACVSPVELTSHARKLRRAFEMVWRVFNENGAKRFAVICLSAGPCALQGFDPRGGVIEHAPRVRRISPAPIGMLIGRARQVCLFRHAHEIFNGGKGKLRL
jgi:hypothetical protein